MCLTPKHYELFHPFILIDRLKKNKPTSQKREHIVLLIEQETAKPKLKIFNKNMTAVPRWYSIPFWYMDFLFRLETIFAGRLQSMTTRRVPHTSQADN